MKSSRSRFSVILLFALLGCASDPVPEAPPIDVLEQNLADAFTARADYLIADAIAAARQRYESLDDLAGQWRVTRIAALYALAADRRELAADEASRLDALRRQLEVGATGGFRVGYETDIIIGRALGDDSAFRRVIRDSAFAVDRAVALTYLNETMRAQGELDGGTDRPGDRAFVLYRHGSATGSASHLERALDFYRQTGDTRGVADSLFALARVAAERNDTTAAAAYAERSRRALLAIGDSTRAEAVAIWLSRQ